MNKFLHNEIRNVLISAKITTSSYYSSSGLPLHPSNHHYHVWSRNVVHNDPVAVKVSPSPSCSYLLPPPPRDPLLGTATFPLRLTVPLQEPTAWDDGLHITIDSPESLPKRTSLAIRSNGLLQAGNKILGETASCVSRLLPATINGADPQKPSLTAPTLKIWYQPRDGWPLCLETFTPTLRPPTVRSM